MLNDHPKAVLIGWAEKGLNVEAVQRMEGKEAYDWESLPDGRCPSWRPSHGMAGWKAHR